MALSKTKKSNLMNTNGERLRFINKEFKAGYKLLETIENGVTYFGSSRIQLGEHAYNEARQLSANLAKKGFTAITGGGPGIMEAANRGAIEAGGRSVSFNIELATEHSNKFTQESVTFHHFFVRKVMLASSGSSYVFFPGGFGTLDEFFEISTLIKTNSLHKEVPVVLVGVGYWKPLMVWLRNIVVDRYHGFEPIDFDMWRLVDKTEEAEKIITRCSGRMGVCKY